MDVEFAMFESIVRRAGRFTDSSEEHGTAHPFQVRNIHHKLPIIVRQLFDDGHYAQATFEAFKFLDHEVQRHSSASEFGTALMMKVFGGTKPPLLLTPMKTQSDQSEQEGYKFLFAGGVFAIRNPRGHNVAVADDPDKCLDHLAFASMLMRRLEEAGYQ